MNTTAFRLFFDSLFQGLVWLAYGASLWLNPKDWASHLVVFSCMLCVWQGLHAWYKLSRYNDLQGARYLEHLGQIAAYLAGIAGISLLVFFNSSNFLHPYLDLVLKIMYWGLCLLLPALTMRYFYKSLRNLYASWTKPRSFWDL